MAWLGKRRLALFVALAAVLAGGTAVALAATGSSHTARHQSGARGHVHTHSGAIAAASSYLGLSPSRLRAELASGRTLGQIAAATPGRSETGLREALIAAAEQRGRSAGANLSSRVEALIGGHAVRHAAAARHGPLRLREAIVSYLGIPRKQLLSQLRSGQTLAQIADATPGRSAAGLREALIAALRARLDSKVAAHVLSKTAEQHRIGHLETRITAAMSRSHPGRGLHAHKGGA